jgi:hypothetical protein
VLWQQLLPFNLTWQANTNPAGTWLAEVLLAQY